MNLADTDPRRHGRPPPLGVFVALFALTVRRGVKDPVCGLTVDRSKALTATHAGQTYSYCSEGCRTTFLASPEHSHHD